MVRTLLCIASLAAPLSTAAPWVVGPRPHGEVRFTVQGPLDDVSGVTRDVSGSFQLDPANLAAVSGAVAVALDTLKTGIDQRDDDMRVQFLETSRFPHALLTIERIERTSRNALAPGQEADGEAIGTFELHGRRRAMRVPVRFTLDDAQRLWVAGTLEVPFSDYGIVRPRRLFLKLGETAEVRFKVLFVPAAPTPGGPASAQQVEPPPEVPAPTVSAVLPASAKVKRPARPTPRTAVSPRPLARHPDPLVRAGETLFFSELPGRERRLACTHCHANTDERAGLKQADGYVRPASTVWNSAQRPHFWGGLARTVGAASDICVRKFVDEAGLRPDERAALEAYLKVLSPDPAPDYYYSTLYRTMESPVSELLRGDAKAGAKKQSLHCGVCHDRARAAPALQQGLYEPEWVVRRVRWIDGHQSVGCPPTRMTRLNDTDLRDIVTWLTGPTAGAPIFARPR